MVVYLFGTQQCGPMVDSVGCVCGGRHDGSSLVWLFGIFVILFGLGCGVVKFPLEGDIFFCLAQFLHASGMKIGTQSSTL